tara:strand:+ start:97 stop:444 length:348 start_codon:yes stop_codon:yes gene_type:complete
MKSLERAQNDLGGQPAGLVGHDAHDPTLFERRVDAIFRLLVEPPVSLFTVDAQRRVMENVASDLYTGLTYYELWMESVRRLLIEREVLTADEIEGRFAEVEEHLMREHKERHQQG